MVSPLEERLGVVIEKLTAEETRGRMPVEGNTQIAGILHGGDIQPADDEHDEPECVGDRSMRPVRQPRAEEHARGRSDQNGDDVD